MRTAFVLLVLSVIGYSNVFAWQEVIIYSLEESGCRVLIQDSTHLNTERFMGALVFALCYPISLLSVGLVSQFAYRNWRKQELFASIISCIVGGNLGGLLRAMLIVKIHLQDAFSNGEEIPSLLAETLEITQWISYGLLSGLVMCGVVLVPVGLLGNSEE
jgi:hypothetical protein